ncbi:TRAP transporter substrate-binding protein DctP [Amaricoccus tamworthensis]|uniref:TRAP transporter substrate-binding protein DctP n=1 Tax=Amaricoccus tamworthensis TaxID=57002 RepID=UPI003C7C8E41
MPATTPWGRALEEFSHKVSELTAGNITVVNYFNSQLGDEQTVARQLARGRIDMALLSNVASSLLVPDYGLLQLPYVFDTVAQRDCAVDGYLHEVFDAEFEDAGVILLSTFEVGRMVIMSKTAFRTPEEMQGQKIRTSPTPADTLFIQATGAAAVPLGTLDSMPALKTGAVVAVTTPLVMGVAAGYAAEAPQIIMTAHGHQLGALLISNRTWERLEPSAKEAISRAALGMADLREATREAEENLLKEAEADGAVIHELSPAELESWKRFAPDVRQSIITDLGDHAAEIWAGLNEVKSVCGS